MEMEDIEEVDVDEEVIQSSQELYQLFPAARPFVNNDRQRIREEVTAEVSREYERMFDDFFETGAVGGGEEPVVPQPNVIVDNFEPVTNTPEDGVYKVKILPKFHPLLRESKSQFKPDMDDRSNSSTELGKKAIALLMRWDENEYERVTTDDYETICRLRPSQCIPGGVCPSDPPGWLDHVQIYTYGTENRRSIFAFSEDTRRGKVYPFKRMCSVCFRFCGGYDRADVYNNRIVCPNCGDEKRFAYQSYKLDKPTEEKVFLFTRKYKVTTPLLPLEKKQKEELRFNHGINKITSISSKDRKELKPGQGFCSADKVDVSHKSSCQQMIYMFKTLFKKRGKRTKFMSSRIQIPKGNLAHLVQLLQESNIKMTGTPTDDPPPDLPPFVREFKNGDKLGVVYIKYNRKVYYVGKRVSEKESKNNPYPNQIFGSADFIYEAETKTKLEEMKFFTCPDTKYTFRMEAIVTIASIIAYFLQLNNPLTQTPVNLLNMEVNFGELDLETDGQYVLDMLHRIFHVKLDFSF